MRASVYPWSLRSILQGRPTLGGLMELCEENYRLLARLIPELAHVASYEGKLESTSAVCDGSQPEPNINPATSTTTDLASLP